MNCAVCGLPLGRTRCGKNSRLVCRRGHKQPDEVAQKAVEEQGIGE